jgi:hypothetical protein
MADQHVCPHETRPCVGLVQWLSGISTSAGNPTELHTLQLHRATTRPPSVRRQRLKNWAGMRMTLVQARSCGLKGGDQDTFAPRGLQLFDGHRHIVHAKPLGCRIGMRLKKPICPLSTSSHFPSPSHFALERWRQAGEENAGGRTSTAI